MLLIEKDHLFASLDSISSTLRLPLKEAMQWCMVELLMILVTKLQGNISNIYFLYPHILLPHTKSNSHHKTMRLCSISKVGKISFWLQIWKLQDIYKVAQPTRIRILRRLFSRFRLRTWIQILINQILKKNIP